MQTRGMCVLHTFDLIVWTDQLIIFVSCWPAVQDLGWSGAGEVCCLECSDSWGVSGSIRVGKEGLGYSLRGINLDLKFYPLIFVYPSHLQIFQSCLEAVTCDTEESECYHDLVTVADDDGRCMVMELTVPFKIFGAVSSLKYKIPLKPISLEPVDIAEADLGFGRRAQRSPDAKSAASGKRAAAADVADRVQLSVGMLSQSGALEECLGDKAGGLCRRGIKWRSANCPQWDVRGRLDHCPSLPLTLVGNRVCIVQSAVEGGRWTRERSLGLARRWQHRVSRTDDRN